MKWGKSSCYDNMKWLSSHSRDYPAVTSSSYTSPLSATKEHLISRLFLSISTSQPPNEASHNIAAPAQLFQPMVHGPRPASGAL
jgi:hypothetical protein